MNNLRKLVVAPLVLASLGMLSACGGGSGGGDSARTPSDGDDNLSVTKTFTVNLESVQVSRVSNGETVDVDTSEVSNSGSLTTSE